MFLALGILAGAALAREETLGKSVESLLDYAKARNPELAAMRLEAEAARERVYPAGALPDPVLRTELQNVTNFGSDASPNLLPSRVGGAKYTLIQPVPFWGKRDLKRAAAEAEADAAQAKAGLTYRNRYPDFSVGVSPMQTRNRVNEWELMLEFNIPLQQESRRSQEREAKQDIVKAQAEQQERLADIERLIGEDL